MLLGKLISEDLLIKPLWRGIDVKGLSSDSRDVKEGFLFAALSGCRLDGSRFIADACRRGAVAVLSDAQNPLPSGLGVPIIPSPNPRRSFAFMASNFYVTQPQVIAAVTGTNGKTSVASFLQQIWCLSGITGASMGTVGLVTPNGTVPLQHTTPEPVELHSRFSDLVRGGITHLAMEASSQGLHQNRMDGVRVTAAAFTNMGRDHLDYHGSFDDYLKQKIYLFTDLLNQNGVAVINADAVHAELFINASRRRGVRMMTVGHSGSDLKISRKEERTGLVQSFDIRDCDGREHHVNLPLVGEFQVSNALVAAGLAVACGMGIDQVLSAMEYLEGVVGRLEMVGETPHGASVFVDYAHTPDGLKTVLEVLRPHARRRLVVIFGAGGDRDQEKRPEMGQIAGEHADIVIVTDDNPRNEDPAAIRAAILAEVPNAIEIGDRRTAIAAGVKLLRSGDVLVVAGKGHETGQIVRNGIIPFSDHEAIGWAIEDTRCHLSGTLAGLG